MVVSLGATTVANLVSSKPTIERSSGTRTPRSRAACMAPIAIESLNAKIAVGGSARSRRLPAATAPGSSWKSASTSRAGVAHQPCRPKRSPIAAPAFFGRYPPWRPRNGGDPTVPERQQVLHCLIGPRTVRR